MGLFSLFPFLLACCSVYKYNRFLYIHSVLCKYTIYYFFKRVPCAPEECVFCYNQIKVSK